MSMGKWILCAALAVPCATIAIADDQPATTQPTEAKPARPKKLTEPWSLMKTLTADQTAQIEKIHSDALEERKKIDAKEHDDIMALLTPDQVTELKAAEDKIKAERKEKAAERRKAATEPTE